MIAWPQLNGKPIGRVLTSSSWESPNGIIADVTRSGKRIARANHVKAPDAYSITMHMTLEEYRAFDSWWKDDCRKGVHTFSYPRINDNTGEMVEYQFSPDSGISVQNTSALNIELSMNWLEA